MKTTDQRAEQLAANAQRLADIERGRIARRDGFSAWVAPRRIAEAPYAEPPAPPPPHPDQFLADFARRFL